jgi:hypothetical protein
VPAHAERAIGNAAHAEVLTSTQIVEAPMKSFIFSFVVIASFVLGSCSSSRQGGAPPPPATFTIGGTVSGLSGTGLVLQDNGGDSLSLSANGAFTFATALASGSAYSVAVSTQPSSPAQTCAVTNGSGTAVANVTNVQVACTTTPTFTIGGMVSGLSGTGLVLQDNGDDNLTVSANGSFVFAKAVASGGTYDVTVHTQPSNPAQTCSVTNGSGKASANVTNVQVTCADTPTFTIGGTVSGLTGSGLVLQDNGDDDLTVSASGPFTFSAALTSGSDYDVTVLTQPSNPVQTCTVTHGTGKATANVTNVVVACGGAAAVNEWTWEGGCDANTGTCLAQSPTFGTRGTAAPTNNPGARDSAATWTDAAGNLWLFGGFPGFLNDLWKYSGGEWTWVSGSNAMNQPGTYGTEATTAPGNVPGARADAVTWIDTAGNLWLFGGLGCDSSATCPFGGVELNDLWKYSPSLNEWTWMGGSKTGGQAGIYGTQGTAAPGNIPGARQNAVSWIDKSGNFWLFGGLGDDINDGLNDLNDLWEFSGGQWRWVSGSDQVLASGTYGTEGTAAPGNVPGARDSAVGWSDAAGNMWLFGGFAGGCCLNDLWRFSAGEWTWMSGSNMADQSGVYGTQGTAAPGNVPGARQNAVSWADAHGNFWLFGGAGYDSTGTLGMGLDDLWKFSAGEWTWMGGSTIANQPGVYGTQGTAAPGNIPGARSNALRWTDKAGNFWLFGGIIPPNGADLNDLWEYVP